MSRGGKTTKIHTIVDGVGNPILFHLTGGNIFDRTPVCELLDEIPIKGSNIPGDKGYISGSIQEKIARKGVTVTTPLRKNMKDADKINDTLLGKRRKKIETVFSSLERLGIQDFRRRSILESV
ncbi:transposase [Bacillus cereus]|uniref:transposase n=1 Tax=Bacillus cereus TaxID=1396 RepID=UPI001CEF8466|nr:transposase [Bacillus cereus]